MTSCSCGRTMKLHECSICIFKHTDVKLQLKNSCRLTQTQSTILYYYGQIIFPNTTSSVILPKEQFRQSWITLRWLNNTFLVKATEWTTFLFLFLGFKADYIRLHIQKRWWHADCKSEYCLLCWTGKDGLINHWHSPCWNRIGIGCSRLNLF